MITFSRLGSHGQLGNQMFQYALLLGIMDKTGFHAKIPKHIVGKKKKRGLFELDKFHTSIPKLRRIDLRFVNHSYTEKGFAFDPYVFDQPDGTDYVGYYQSEKYFEHIRDTVVKEFTFLLPIRHYAMKYVEDIRTCDCVVSVHVRRGDYLDRPDLFQILSPEYYQKAMMNPAIPDKRQWLVFSDDLNWCRENISNEFTTFVESPSHWHDMAIMVQCDAHIMAASSFSWWGSWLGEQVTKGPVIAPFPWFPLNGPRGGYDMKDILPDRWIKQKVE